MKVFFISTPSRTYTPNYIPPLGCMYLAAHLRNCGHEVTISDVARTRKSRDEIINEIQQFNPDLIALSGIITAYRFVRRLVADLKREIPHIPIVIGGHIVLDIEVLLLNEVGIDFVISGYGEIKLAHLLDALSGVRSFSEIPGLSYKKYGKVITNPGELFFKNTDDIPHPAYDLVDMEYYVTVFKEVGKLTAYLKKAGKPTPPMRSFMVIAALGCTDHCSFCVHEFGRRGLHLHSVDYIIKNMRVLYEQYGVRIFFIGEDLFLINNKQWAEFFTAMSLNFPDAYFQTGSRANFFNPELIALAEKSNCYSLAFGFESGNNFILNILNKRVTRDVNIRAYRLISSSNITAAATLMVGTPGETRETISDTINAIKEARMTDGLAFFTTPYPGSRLYRWCIENGLIGNQDAYLDYISDRDAVKLSINFTPYPDVIVKMMKIMVENAFEDNKKQIDSNYRIPIIRAIVHHRLVPLLYNGYFDMRWIVGKIIPKYRKETIEYKLNKKGTVKISSDE